MSFQHIQSLPNVPANEPGVFRWTVAEQRGTEQIQGDDRNQVGITLVEPGSATEELVHSVAEFVFVVGGELLVTIDGVEEPIGSGQFVLIRPGSVHSYRNITDQEAHMIFVFAGDMTAAI